MSFQCEISSIFEKLFRSYTGPNFGIRLWDGLAWRFSEQEKPACTLELRDAAVLRSLIVDPSELNLGEAFIRGELEVDGDLLSALDVAAHIMNRSTEARRSLNQSIMRSSIRLRQWLRDVPRHTRSRDRDAISYHYDQPVEFYRLWLGSTLAYSCAYFCTGHESLDRAQENKFDLICRKLRLQPFERVLDIGCGWGGFVLHAAAHYDACAHGITLSEQQAATARQRIKNEHLTESCVVELRDYRDIPALSPFDKIASVGMVEHVGLKNLPRYFRAAHQVLKPGGVFLNHGIARAQWSTPSNASFIDRYVFPDCELVTLNQVLHAAEEAGFEVRDVENLREHYEQTLRRWVKGLEQNAAAALQHVSQTTFRIWRLYMAGSAAAFRHGDIAIYQTLLSRPAHGNSRLPLTRDDWYASQPPFAEAGI